MNRSSTNERMHPAQARARTQAQSLNQPLTSTASDVLDELVAEWAMQVPEFDTKPMLVIGRIIRIASLLHAELTRMLKPCGLHYTDFDILATLRRKGSPHELSPTQLSDAVILTSGAMTAALKRLEKSALIRRVDDKSDGRGKKVRLTAKGVRLVEKVADLRFSLASDNVANLSRAEKEQLGHLLKKLLCGLI